MSPTNAVATAPGGDSSSSSSSAGGSGGTLNGKILKKGPWTAAEDAILMEYVKKHGEGNWNAVQKNSGLSRCGKSCRLRWANHLRPDLKKGSFTPQEERLILELHAKYGNKWARMASQLPGRTDNEIKNYWNTRIKRRQRAGLPLYPPEIQRQAALHHHQQHQPSSFSTSPSSSTLPLPIPSQSFQETAPLPLFDPTSFSSAPPPLRHHLFLPPAPLPQFKHFHDTNIGSAAAPFSLPFSSSLPSLLPHSFHQNLQPQQQQQQQQQNLQFSSSNFSLNPPIMQPMPFHPDRLLLTVSNSVKLELPSSQVPDPAITESGPNDYNSNSLASASLGRSNSGLLEAMLQEAQVVVDSSHLQKESLLLSEPVTGKCGLDGWVANEINSRPLSHEGGGNQWDDSSSSPIGMEMKKEPTEDINSVEEDFSNLLDLIPASMPTVPDWYSDSGEISNAHSGGTDDDIGLEMHQLASSLSTTTDHDWTVGSRQWNNLPGIC